MTEQVVDSGNTADGGVVNAGNAAPAADPAPASGNPANEGGAPSLLDDKGGNPSGAPDANTNPAAGVWPENWRDQMSGSNDKLKGVLARFTTPGAVAEALLATRQKLSSGEFKKGLGENPTPEELNAYRQENGIPESYDKYDTTLDGGLVLGEDQKPFVESFLKEMHGANMSQGMVKQVLTSYAKNLQAHAEAEAEADEGFRTSNEDKLRSEWGNEYRTNLNGANSFLQTQPEGFRNAILNGRDAEGRPLRTNSAVVMALAELGVQMNPIATIMPGAGTNAMQAMETEMETIQKAMGNPHGEYWKGPKDEQGRTKMQARYQDLLTAKERAR